MGTHLKFEWETIKALPSCQTHRAKVIGGWIINQVSVLKDNRGHDQYLSDSMVFVPDPNHEWLIMYH